MAIQDFLDKLSLTRRFVRSTERLATALEQQNAILLRIADHLAPVLPAPTAEDIQTSGAFTRNSGQLARLEEWVASYRVKFGHDPDEQAVEEWLFEDAERQPQ